MPIEEKSTGLLVNYANKIDALQCPGEGVRVAGDQYDGGFASGSIMPNAVIFDKTFEKHDIEGYFAMRIFYDTNPVAEYGDWVATLEIYEDGVLKVWDYGDQSDGKLKLGYMDQTQILGSRALLWFDPKKSYRVIVRTAPTISGYSVNLDYVQFTQVHHGNLFLNWVNASETIGGYLQVIDTVWGTVTGSGTATASTTVSANYPFKEILHAWGSVDDHPEFNITMDTSGLTEMYGSGTEVPILVGRGDGAAWSGSLSLRMTILGTVEVPMIRPL